MQSRLECSENLFSSGTCLTDVITDCMQQLLTMANSASALFRSIWIRISGWPAHSLLGGRELFVERQSGCGRRRRMVKEWSLSHFSSITCQLDSAGIGSLLYISFLRISWIMELTHCIALFLYLSTYHLGNTFFLMQRK